MTNTRTVVSKIFPWCRQHWAWLLSGLLHILFFLALILITTWSASPKEFNTAFRVQSHNNVKVIQAHAISAKTLDNELDRIAEIKRQKIAQARQREAARLAKLRAQRVAKRKAAERKAQQKKLAVQKAKQAQVAKKQAAIKKLQALGVSGLDHAVKQEKSAQRALTEKEKYMGLIQQIIRSNWINQFDISSKLTVTLQIQLDAQGDVLGVAVVKSSGDAAFDRQAVLAVRKSSPLPLPENKLLATQFRSLILPFSS